MINFIKKNIALIWAKNHVKGTQSFKENAVRNQEQVLLSLIRTAEKTLFGRTHQFENIKSVQDYQNRVQIADYEDLKPYIEKVKKGERHILWPETPEYFAKTSGTTSGSKYIPISKEAMPYQIAAAQSAIFHYIAQQNNADFVAGKMIFIQGSPELEEINGIKTGRLSGIVAHHIPSYLQKNRLPSLKTNLIEDWETKVDEIVKETEKENMTLISGIPPWLIMYFEKLIERNGKKITELFPNLQLIITGGVNYEPYREKMNELLGKPVDTLQTFPASEGFFAFQDDFNKEGLPYHEWFIEFEKEPENLENFRKNLDEEMRKRNSYYDDLISGKILQPLMISSLKKNAFQDYAKSEGKLGGQNKIPRLANDRKIAEFLERLKK